MRASSPLLRLAGSPPARTLVNRAFHREARRRVAELKQAQPSLIQDQVLRRLVHKARNTRFGRDHGFASIRSAAEFQAAVPLRTYDDLWTQYLKDHYPRFDNLTWPGLVPYLALT